MPLTALLAALLLIAGLLLARPALAYPSLGLLQTIVAEKPGDGSFPLLERQQAAPLYVSASDFPGVRRAAADLQSDIERVGGVKPQLSQDGLPSTRFAIVIGTIGKSTAIDRLIQSGQLKVDRIAGQWESFEIATVAHPFPGVDQALVIAGSDRRGAIYGIYELSEQIGVSPWYWWADVPAQHHAELFVRPGVYVQGPPAVKYRGIFINDEDPAFSGWAKEKFGGINSKMYAHLFELLLRLRANYLWPAMWGKAFNEDDPENPRVADEYGIVMGTSHHEPMMCSQSEWDRHRKTYGNGEWNYVANGAGLRSFWTDGVVRNKSFENIYTIGMRGDGDVAMPDAGGLDANKRVLEGIMHDQREILARNVDPDLSKVPQLWALFTEVQRYYDAGLRVPDDVTLLFTDDNVGNLRRLPTPAERKREGGAGIYYHLDMNGGPFSYKWLNSNPLPKIQEQMNLAYRYGATQIWIANVGDLKPLEIPIEFFLRMAWSPDDMPRDGVAAYQQRWAAREFGPEHAVEIAEIVARYAKYNAWRKPELVKPETFSLLQDREAEEVAHDWTVLTERAETIARALPANEQDAYEELVLHPVKASANLVLMNIAAARNRLFADQGRASSNDEAELTRHLFAEDRRLTDRYNHQLAGGRWNHMMDQTHLGYTSWYSPQVNVMPAVAQVDSPDTAEFGVAVEGAAAAWPAPVSTLLPAFDSLHRQRSFLEIFPIGTQPVHTAVNADRPWIKLTEGAAFSTGGYDRRIWVEIDWTKAPEGESNGTVTVRGQDRSVAVHVRATRFSEREEQAAMGSFSIADAPIAINAQDTAQNIAANGVRWEPLPDYGPGRSAMTVFPVTAASVRPSAASPSLLYPVYFTKPGSYHVDLVTNPTLDTYPGRGLSAGVSLDAEAPQVVDVFAPETRTDQTFLGRSFNENAKNNSRILHFHVQVNEPGKHTLRLSMGDPTMVIEKILIYGGPAPTSYFGPKAEQPFDTSPQP